MNGQPERVATVVTVRELLAPEAATLWACDCFSTKVWISFGVIEFLVLYILHVGSRYIHIGGTSANPDAA